MSEVLARIRVRETHGIRRFLYPLMAIVELPDNTNLSALSLATNQGTAVPLQVTRHTAEQFRVDFAVSLAPFQEDMELLLTEDGPQADVPDPLHLTQQAEDELQSMQKRFSVTLGAMGEISEVVYDGVLHLTESELRAEYPAAVRRPNPEDEQYKRGLVPLEAASKMPVSDVKVTIGGGPLAAWHRTTGIYADGSATQVVTEITACKSWVKTEYHLEQPIPGEVIAFNLPLATNFQVQPPTRTIFDCGVDGIYGRVDYFGQFLNWYAPTEKDGFIRWEIGRNHAYENGQNLSPVDYTGTVSKADFQQQRWFHLVNGSQAVAVAITKLPDEWKSLKIALRHNIGIKCELSETVTNPADFGICYHFLNDVPAIAAATNPQSILLPPVVEVLPV